MHVAAWINKLLRVGGGGGGRVCLCVAANQSPKGRATYTYQEERKWVTLADRWLRWNTEPEPMKRMREPHGDML